MAVQSATQAVRYGVFAGVVTGILPWLMGLPLSISISDTYRWYTILSVYSLLLIFILAFLGEPKADRTNSTILLISAASSYTVAYAFALLRWELLHPQNLALAAVLSTSTLLLKRIFFDRRLPAKQATSAN